MGDERSEPVVVQEVQVAVPGADTTSTEVETASCNGRPKVNSEDTTQQAAAAAVGDAAAKATAGKAKPKKRHRVRGWIAAILVVFAVLFAIVTAVAWWSNSLLLDTDTYVNTVAPILKDEQVTKAAGEVVADETIKATDLERRLEQIDPSEIGVVAVPVTEEIRAELAQSVTDLLRTETAYSAWETILRFSHEQLVALLRDESDVAQIKGDKVQVDLVPYVIAGVEELEKIVPGVIEGSGSLPTLGSDASLEEQRKELAAYLGEPVSEDFGTITLFESSQIETAQWAVQIFDLLVWVLLGITIVLVIAALLVSPRRLRTLVQLGVGVVFVVLVTIVAVDEVRNVLVANATGESGELIVGAVDGIFDSLRNAVIWLLVAGVVIAAVAFIATRPRWSKSVGGGSALAGWLRSYADAIRIVVGAAAVLVVLFTPISFGGGLALIAVAAVIIITRTWLKRREPEVDAGAPS